MAHLMRDPEGGSARAIRPSPHARPAHSNGRAGRRFVPRLSLSSLSLALVSLVLVSAPQFVRASSNDASLGEVDPDPAFTILVGVLCAGAGAVATLAVQKFTGGSSDAGSGAGRGAWALVPQGSADSDAEPDGDGEGEGGVRSAMSPLELEESGGASSGSGSAPRARPKLSSGASSRRSLTVPLLLLAGLVCSSVAAYLLWRVHREMASETSRLAAQVASSTQTMADINGGVASQVDSIRRDLRNMVQVQAPGGQPGAAASSSNANGDQLPIAVASDPAANASVSLTRLPLLYLNMHLDTPFHNLGYPSLLALCDDWPAGRPRPDDCQRLDDIPAEARAAPFKAEASAIASPSTGRVSGSRTTPYRLTPTQSLIRNGGFVIVYWPAPGADHPSSSGPWVLNNLAFELHALGYPAAMHIATQYYMRRLNQPAEVAWPSFDPADPRLGGNFLLVTPEANQPPDMTKRFVAHGARPIKWVLGFHGAPEGQIDPNYVNICFIRHFSTLFKCPRSTPLWSPNPPDMAEAGLAYRRASDPIRKEKLVLYDNDMAWDVPALQRQLPDVQFVRFAGLSRQQAIDTYKRAMVTVDFGLPGGEAINSEGTLFDCITMISRSRAGSSDYDFSFPSRYKLDPFNNSEIVSAIRDAVDHYDARIGDFALYKDISVQQPRLFRRDLHMFFHARSVLFYLYADTIESLRGAVATILSIRHLYPLARVELLSRFSIEALSYIDIFLWRALQNHMAGVVVHTLPPELREEASTPHRIFQQPPLTRNADYIVFVPYVHVLLLGVDWINTRVHAMHQLGIELLAIADEGEAGAPSLDVREPVLAAASSYWSRFQSAGSANGAWVPASSSADLLQRVLGFPLQQRASLQASLKQRGLPPLPLDLVLLDPLHTEATFYSTASRSLSFPLIRRNPTPPPHAEHVAFSPFLLTASSQLPLAVRELIDLLLSEPLWHDVQPHLPEIYQTLRYLI